MIAPVFGTLVKAGSFCSEVIILSGSLFLMERESHPALPGEEDGFFLLPFLNTKLSAMDVLARTTMKDAANCDTQCELQNSVNH